MKKDRNNPIVKSYKSDDGEVLHMVGGSIDDVIQKMREDRIKKVKDYLNDEYPTLSGFIEYTVASDMCIKYATHINDELTGLLEEEVKASKIERQQWIDREGKDNRMAHFCSGEIAGLQTAIEILKQNKK